MLISNQTATSQPLSNSPHINCHSTQASMNGRNVIATDSVLQKGVQHLSSALQKMPNPLYYIAKMPGQILPAALLMSRVIGSDAKSLPAGSELKGFAAEGNSSLPETGTAGLAPAANDSAKAQMLEEIARDGGETAHQHLVSSLKQSGNSGSPALDMPNTNVTTSKSRPKGTGWQSVPVPGDFNRALNQNETTKNGEFARTIGKGVTTLPSAVQEREIFPRRSKPNTSYRFTLDGVTNADLKKKLPKPKGCLSKPDNLGAAVNLNNQRSNSSLPHWCPHQSQSYLPSAELTTCFHTADSSPGESHLADFPLEFASGMYLDSCPKAVPAGETISGSMDIHIKRAGPATIFQIHSTPDRLLYRDNAGAIHTLSQQASKDAYEHLINDGMQFDQEGKPPFSISIDQKNSTSEPYLVITGRSDFAKFTDTQCDLPVFSGGETPVKITRCCDDRSSAAYLYHMPLSGLHNPEYLPDYANVKYEIDFSNYTGSAATKGRVKVWIDDRNVISSSIYIGANNRPERGGGQYFATFGISDLRSLTPVVVKFTNVEFNQGKLSNPPEGQLTNEYNVKYNIPVESNLGECTGRIDQQCP